MTLSRNRAVRVKSLILSTSHSSLSPILCIQVMIDLGDLLCGTAHEEKRDAEEGGNGQHDHREAWDGLQRETRLLHDDSTRQHPHGYCRQIYSTCEPQILIMILRCPQGVSYKSCALLFVC